MERLLASRDVEWTCDDVHRCLDQYAELMVRGARGGAEAARLLPMVQQHLDMCPDCREEYEALLRILRAQ